MITLIADWRGLGVLSFSILGIVVTADSSFLETPLYAWHQARGGRLVEFGGWLMPVQYTSIVEEHKAVRERVGLFDVSHMGRVTFDGPQVLEWLDHATTNSVASLVDLKIQYSLLANERGGVIDDILVYRQPFAYLVVCNASNRAAALAHLKAAQGDFEGNMVDRTRDTAMIAVQGPRALETLEPLFDQPLESIGYYHMTMGRLMGRVNAVVSRTGYTGEDGFEAVVGAHAAVDVWEALMESGARFGIAPCGLGARDTLRLEAAMPLHAHELSEDINPFEAGVGWAVKLDKREFMGRSALIDHASRPARKRVGLVLDSRRIARQGADVSRDGGSIGVVTSGTFSPTLDQSIAMAFVEPGVGASDRLEVDVRGRRETARLVKLPFYKRPRPVVSPR